MDDKRNSWAESFKLQSNKQDIKNCHNTLYNVSDKVLRKHFLEKLHFIQIISIPTTNMNQHETLFS